MDSSLAARLNHEAQSAGCGVGSDEYYAARFAKASLRYRAWCLFTLKKTIEEIPLKVQDPGVARLKLAWWQDQQARRNHPLFKLGEELGIAVDGLHRATESLSKALESEYHHNGFTDQDARSAWFEQAYTNIFELIDTDLTLAIRLEESRSVLRIRDQLQMNICRLTHQELTHHGLNRENLLAVEHREAWQRLVMTALRRGAENLHHALERRTTRGDPSRAYAAISLQRLHETIADGGHIMTRKIELTALRKLWIGWRCRWL